MTRNSGTAIDVDWEPLSQDTDGEQFSPCFPAWVSGHATFGGAWSRVMENEFAHADFTDPFPLELSSEDPNAIVHNADEREFDSFAEAGEENAESRIWLGVHYRVDAEDGVATGRGVGRSGRGQRAARGAEVRGLGLHRADQLI